MVPDLRPRGVGEILDAAAALYRARFGQLIRYAAMIVVPVQLLTTVVLLSAQPDRFTVSATGNAVPQFDTGHAQLGATAVVLVIGLLTHVFITAVTTRVVANEYVGHEETGRRLLSTTGRRFFAVIGVGVLVGLSEILGAAFCFIGYFAALVFFSVAIPALLLERKSVIGAMSRSMELTKTHFWRALAVILSATAIALVLNIALAAALVAFAGHASSTTAVIAQGFSSIIAATLTTPFVATTAVALYFDLRIRNEAFDVQLAMSNALAGGTPAGSW